MNFGSLLQISHNFQTQQAAVSSKNPKNQWYVHSKQQKVDRQSATS